RPWRMLDERREQLAHSEVVDGRAEENGRLLAAQVLLHIEARRCAAHELDLLAKSCRTLAQKRLRFLAHQAIDVSACPDTSLLARLIDVDTILEQVIDASQIAAHPDGPGHGRALNLQDLLDLVEQLHRLAPLAVELVDEGHDGRIA